MSQTSAGSNEAPHASGVGKIVAVQAAKPVRHSSCATAGMPNLLAHPALDEVVERRPVLAEEQVLHRGDAAVVARGAHPDAAELGELLLQGHPAEQVGDSLGNREPGVSPGFDIGLGHVLSFFGCRDCRVNGTAGAN